MIRNLAALISLTVLFSGSFVLSTQSVEAKTSRKSSHKAINYFVPPPPPYAPSIVPSALGMVNAYSNYIFTSNQGYMPQVVHSHVSFNPGVEKRIQNEIDYFDSEISSHVEEISKLLKL